MKYIEEVLNIYKNWYKIKSLLILQIGTILCWYSLAKNFVGESHLSSQMIVKFGDSFIFLLIILGAELIVWLITTNRVPLLSPSKINIYLCINLDDISYEEVIKLVIKKAIAEIKQSSHGTNINVQLLDFNYFEHQNQVESWVSKYSTTVHTIIFIKLRTGNVDGNKKMTAEELSFTGKLPINSLSVGTDIVNGISEIKYLLDGSNWEFLEKNSFDDKEKLTKNIGEIIKFYAVVCLLYQAKLKEAIKLLSEIYDKNISTVSKLNFSQRIDKMMRKKITKQLRFGSILFHVLFQYANDLSAKKQFRNALDIYKELEGFSIKIADQSQLYISIAYCYYRCNDINKALEYTNKFRLPEYNDFYNINRLFISICQNNLIDYYCFFKKIKPQTTKLNPIQILADYDFERERGVMNIELLDFAECLIEVSYLGNDIISITERIKELQSRYPVNDLNKELHNHLLKILKQQKLRTKNFNKNFNSLKSA